MGAKNVVVLCYHEVSEDRGQRSQIREQRVESECREHRAKYGD
jgi:hypothetical protein